MRCKAISLLLLLLVTVFVRVQAQIPSSCFEIESILVDACGAGASEGLNEEIIFHVGPTALNTANLGVTWPNGSNSWTGVCQNAGTAAKVAQINSTITCCGALIEPVGGVLPAGKRVILFASVNVDVTLHSFANLCDTLIAIFHCGSNAAGNFANNGAGTRTLTMNFSAPVGCTDAVTYDRALVPLSNGASVGFSWAGAPTYFNNGCVGTFISPSPDAGLPQNICIGQTVNLNGTVSAGSYPFAWFGGTGTFSNPNVLNPTYTPGPGEVGSVTLYLGEQTACRNALDSVVITVNQAPAFSLPPDTSFCGNFSYNFGPGIVGNAYAWSNGPTTQNITATAPGTYTLTLTGTNGCIGSDAITIGTFTLGSVGLPNDTSICTGSSMVLLPTIGGGSYNWSTGATTPGIVVSLPGTYTVSMITGSNCLARDTFVLGNYPLPVVDLGPDTTICPGSGFTLDADPLGLNPGATYAWTPSSSNQTISVPGQGTYMVTVTSTNGCVSRDTLVVIESNALSVNIGPDTSICAGATLSLNAGGGVSYVWSTSQTSQNISVSLAGTYSVTVTFGVNCNAADTISVGIDALPVVNLGNDTLYCPSSGLTLDAGNPGSTYVWSPSASTQQINLTTGGTYAVTVTNAAGCVSSDTIVVQTGTEPQVSLGPDIRLCAGSSATLDAGPGNTSYLWSTNATTQTITVNSAGLYYVLGTTNCGTDSAAVNITVAPSPFANAGPSDTLCAGDTLLLAGASAGGASVLWTTSSGTFDAPTAVNPHYISDTSASGPVQLIVTVTDTCGTVSDTVTIEVLPRVQVQIFLPDTVCYQRAVEIFFTSVGDITSFEWLGNGSFADTTTNPTIFAPAPGAAGHFEIQLATTGECGDRVFNTSFYAEDTVIAGFSWQPAVIYPGTWVQFDNQTYLPTLPGHWSFGDGFFSDEHDPEHRFYLPGTYSVELISLGAGGCRDTATLSLTVIRPDTLIPNVFSPNGDGVNDFFDVKVPPTTAFSLAIFDRWGHRVFLSNNPDLKWNGKLNDADMPTGVYYYVIEMTLLSEGILRYNGPVTLLR